MGGGTEAFPDLGRHCQNPDCHQLDFLPFKCDGCGKEFCLDHRSYKSHDCPKLDQNSRKVVVCEVCSTAIEVTGREEGEVMEMLKKHEESKECDPSKKVKPRCAVRRCRETLTFSNACVCKSCRLKVCLKHRFPADHDCKAPQLAKSIAVVKGQSNDKVPLVFASKNSQDCAKNARPSTSKPRIVTVRAR